ncbi:The GLUG motif-containing protein [Trichlorobacter thiogenes]|uniref:The GLUG motif-containing protein n=1 Tax=Trichlorobacter thiogenes TaxID=115783 RepID=A0A1T4P9X7_9BACT|nr:GLUG motif-containing protein [Trichlorobacter thiogenes]SJZ88046.1 The GLUG motif-containing protein [Trichlorobacter thiogenes]
MKIKLQLNPIFLLLLSICLLAPLQAAWADSATVTIGTAASSNGSWSGATPDVWTPGASGVSTVAVSEIADRLANSGVIIGSGSSITVATPISWSSSNTLTLNAGTDISITAAISATSGALKLYYGSSYSLNNGAKVSLSAGPNFFTKQGSNAETSWTVITSLGSAGSTTGTDLQGISGALSGNYVLGADIDASDTTTWNSNGSGGYYGFAPIGNDSTSFSGSFNGLGHTISNLYINRSGATNLSLFGSNTGSISNVGVVGGSITGKNRVGGLAGYNTGSISNAYATANITGVYGVGGLVGFNEGGSISNAYATGSASGTNDYTGGLVGKNSGSINYAYALGSVTGTTSDTGGLVGYNSGSISNAYATGSVTGVTNVGGLVGNNASGTYSNDFWNSTTTGQAYGAGGSATPTGVTGLTSAQMQNASSFSAWGTEISSTGGSTSVWRIYNGYTYPLLRSFMPTLSVTPAFDGSGTAMTNIADVTATSYDAAKLLGSASPLTISSSNAGSYTASVNISSLYSSQQGYDISYSNRTISTPGSGAGDIIISSPITWTSGTLAINTSGTINATAAINGSGSAIFDLQSGSWSQIGSLPDFSVSDFRISGGSFIRASGGDGSSNNPYQITDIYGLQGIGSSADMLTKSYQLANDISASGTATWNSGKGFKPIGTSSLNGSGAPDPANTVAFTGNFYGQNHVIDGLTINRNNQNFVGLFGYVGSGPSFSNLGLTNLNVTGGNYYTGGLAAYSYAPLSNVYASGTVTGSGVNNSWYIGGLLGYNNGGSIDNSHFTGSLAASGGFNYYYFGGLAGYSTGAISNSYADITLSADSYTNMSVNYFGGLAGYQVGNISDSHTTITMNSFTTSGTDVGTSYLGGLAGRMDNGAISNSPVEGNIQLFHTHTNDGGNSIGGLVGEGYNISSISDSHFSGNLLGAQAIGGLIGHSSLNSATVSISNSYSTGAITGRLGSVGGLVGWQSGTGTGSISNSYSTATISSGGGYTGGLVGKGDGLSISDSYYIGTLSGGGGSNYTGGLAGYLTGSISNSHAEGAVPGGSYSGGLVGSITGAVTNSYHIGDVTSTGSTYVGGLIGYTTANVNNLYATGKVTAGSADYVGGLIGYSTGNVSNSYVTGDVIGYKQYIGGLVGMFKGTDISISDSHAIGNVKSSITVDSASASSTYVGGLVGQLYGDNTNITNSYATGNVTGGSGVGGLLGGTYWMYLDDSISQRHIVSNSYATGNVTATASHCPGCEYYGNGDAGGLVGWVDNLAIINSYATGNVSGYRYVGGLMALGQAGYYDSNTGKDLYIYGKIDNSYATGTVSAHYSSGVAGGLVGFDDLGSISNSYAVGAVSATYSGGLVGKTWLGTTISNSFWNTTTTGQSYAIGNNYGDITLTNSTGLTTAQMMTASSFSDAGWSISATGGSPAIWRIYEDKTYPLLRSFLTPMSVTANNAAKNYDATAYSGGNGVLFAPAGYNADRVAGSLTYAGSSQGATAIGSYTITPDGLFSDQLGYDISFISGVLNINGYWLTLGISGSGTVNSSNGSGLGYACNTATCSAVPFGSGDTVTLTATGSNSSFSSWSGDYVSISNPGSITMSANKAVTATFSAGAATVKIDGDNTPYYSINSALAAPTQDATIKATATGFTENVTMQNSHTLTLKGGYSDSNFSSQTGYSTINGSLTISSGTLVVDKVVVGP